MSENRISDPIRLSLIRFHNLRHLISALRHTTNQQEEFLNAIKKTILHGWNICAILVGMATNTTPKKPVIKDWHPADIVASLRKAGWSLRRLSMSHGLRPGTLQQALIRDYPAAEAKIAAAIGVDPETIWAARYAKRSERLAA